MAAKKPFIELERHLVIGIGQGSLTLDISCKSGFNIESWQCVYRPFADGPKNTTYLLPAPVLRQLLKGKRLEKDYKAAYELGRRYKNINAVLEIQLAEAERIRDAKNRVNLESFNELQNVLAETKDLLSNAHDELHIKSHQLAKCEDRVIAAQQSNQVLNSQLKDLEFAKVKDQEWHNRTKDSLTTNRELLHLKIKELAKSENSYNLLNSVLLAIKKDLAEITARQAKLHYKNLIGWKTAIILSVIVIIEMFFIF